MKHSLDPVVDLKDIKFSWPGAEEAVLDIKKLLVHQGQHLFIEGESGCGKTSLLNLLSGITQPERGQIKVLGEALVGLSALRRDQFRADHLGVIFQQFNLLPYLSVLENVALSLHFSKKRRARVKDMATAAKSVLNELEISSDLYDKSVLNLSVGQQQRVAVARALVGNPELIIADEPTSALDAKNRNSFIRLLFELATEHGCTLIFVSHDYQLSTHFRHSINLAEVNQAFKGRSL